MSVISRLASSLGSRDEVPNQELALELCEGRNRADIEELVENLSSKSGAIQSDCIKALYEIGYREPQLISQYVEEFFTLLKSKNNRLVWGAMIALLAIASEKPDEIYAEIGVVLKAIHEGSVITVDNGISVISRVSSTREDYEKQLVPYLLKHLETCRPKEVGQHAEKSIIATNERNKEKFEAVLQQRLDDLTTSQKARVNKVIKKMQTM